MEKSSREKREKCKLLLGLVLILLCVSEVRGEEEISEEDVTSAVSAEIGTGQKSNSRIQFPMDRVPSGLSKRIIGGNVATPHAYPYQAALYVTVQGTLYFCGGTLITPQWVLTAAHCVDQASSVQIVLGGHNIYQEEASQVSLDSTTFVIHKDWDEDILQYDIALIQLPRNVTLNDYIDTVEIAEGSDSYSGIVGRCLGWGKTILGVLSNVLRYVDVEVITNENCSLYDDYTPYIVDHHICTSGAGIVGSCNGDSGGPLIIDGIQVGIVSFGVTDCAAAMPSVFTRVTAFNTWITDTIGTWNYSRITADEPDHGSRISPLLGVYMGVMLCVTLINYL